jgi:preprotein translocase subunit SecE
MANRITAYARQSRDELRKVVWPSRQSTIKNTLLVIGFSLFVAGFLGLVDFLFNAGLEALIQR